MPLNLLLIGSIIVRGFSYLFICSTPREYAENRAPTSFNYGIGYPAPLLVFAIVFEYSLINPLILLFGTVYFCFTYLVYKYQFLYVYFRPYEAAGRLWTMVIPRIIFTMVLFQLTMMGLFILRGSYILAGLVVPLVFFTFLFRYVLNCAYEQNGQNLPMQLLRDNIKQQPEVSDDDSESDSELKDREIQDKSQHSDKSTSTSTMLQENQKKAEIRNRWKKAALSAANLKENPVPIAPTTTVNEDKADELLLVRPRHRKVVLDEDDYEAVPDRLTDYRQPPMQLTFGLLDAGLKTYGNPLLVGVLPQLWLPVKEPVEGEKKKQQKRRRSELLYQGDSQGGSLAQHLAEILRKVENDKKNKSRKSATNDAASIVSGKRPHPKISTLRSMFHRGVIKQSNVDNTSSPTPAEVVRLQHLEASDDAMDSVEKGQLRHEDSSNSSVKSSVKSLHKIYYHHPERKKRGRAHSGLRPGMESARASSPAIVSALNNDEGHGSEEDIGSSIGRLDARKRLSSDPLIKN
ncbi:hypothetical protein CU098_002932, partial [Rhizopus stolonifer]